MEVRCGPGNIFELALEPGELALYIRYGIVPPAKDLVVSTDHAFVEISGFSVPIRYRFDGDSGMGIIEPMDQSATDLPVQWPLFVVEWTECLSTGRRTHGISYTVGPISKRIDPGHHRV